MCHLSYPQLLSCAYSYKYLEVLWLPKRTQLWACFNTEPNRLYRRLRLFPSKLQEYTPPPFSRLSTQYQTDPLLTCLLSLDTSRTSLRLQQSTKFGNRHTAHGRYEYSYNLPNSRENWAQKKKNLREYWHRGAYFCVKFGIRYAYFWGCLFSLDTGTLRACTVVQLRVVNERRSSSRPPELL